MELVDPLLGKQLGNYLLDQRLGYGSCGVVYRCEHVKLKTPFAIKILHPILASNEESAARFLREARTAARIQHENVVFIADFDIEPSIGPYFVMEFLDGDNLREVIDREAPFAPKRIANICEQICHALAAAHREGVIHRDLKPDNISLLPRKQKEMIKILDFGIAKITREAQPGTRDLTQHGRVLGTPRYFSPEQAQGAKIDHRSDIYSFGIILFEMLLGYPPFAGNTPEEMVLYHLTLPPPKLDEARFPEEMQDLVNWLLAKRPDERPDDMEEVWSLLKEALQKMEEIVPPSSHQQTFSGSHSSLPALPPLADPNDPMGLGGQRGQKANVTGTRGYAQAQGALAPRVSGTMPLGIKANELASALQPTSRSQHAALVNVIAEALEKQGVGTDLPSAEVLARAIKDALDKETTLRHNQPPEQLTQAIKDALDKETTLYQKEPPDELLQALEQVLNDPGVPTPLPLPAMGHEDDYLDDEFGLRPMHSDEDNEQTHLVQLLPMPPMIHEGQSGAYTTPPPQEEQTQLHTSPGEFDGTFPGDSDEHKRRSPFLLGPAHNSAKHTNARDPLEDEERTSLHTVSVSNDESNSPTQIQASPRRPEHGRSFEETVAVQIDAHTQERQTPAEGTHRPKTESHNEIPDLTAAMAQMQQEAQSSTGNYRAGHQIPQGSTVRTHPPSSPEEAFPHTLTRQAPTSPTNGLHHAHKPTHSQAPQADQHSHSADASDATVMNGAAPRADTYPTTQQSQGLGGIAHDTQPPPNERSARRMPPANASHTLDPQKSADREFDDLLDASLATMPKPPSAGKRILNLLVAVVLHPLAVLLILVLVGTMLATGYFPFGQTETNNPTPSPLRPIHRTCPSVLKINSFPAKASVWQGKKRLGHTPYTYKGHCGTSVSLTFKRDRYNTITRNFTMIDGEKEENVHLTYAQHILQLRTSPSRASVHKGKLLICRRTPCNLQAQYRSSQTYTLKKNGFITRKITLHFVGHPELAPIQLKRRKRRKRRRRRRRRRR